MKPAPCQCSLLWVMPPPDLDPWGGGAAPRIGGGGHHVYHFRRLAHLGPALRCWEVGQLIVFQPLIELIALALEYRAPPVPTCIAHSSAGDAVWPGSIHTGICPVPLRTCSTCVHCCEAISHHMTPFMAFEAP